MAEPFRGIKSPGQGWRALRFSDGTSAWIPPTATAEQWQSIKKLGEDERDAKYMAQAKAENRPITTVDKTYSSTVARPSTAYGHLMAWMDHNLGGNTLNENPTLSAISNAVRDAEGTAMRVGTSGLYGIPYVGQAARITDLGSTGFNIGKHLLAKKVPEANLVPDIPSLLGQVRSLTGTPELEPDASAGRRILESAASMTNPLNLTPAAVGENVVRAGLSHIGGLAGEELGGEAGQFGGSFLGAAPGSGRALFQRVMAPMFRSRGPNTTTSDVDAAAARQGIQPTMGSVSNAMGRLFEKALAATPGVGGAVRSAQDRFKDAIRQRQQQTAEDIFGGPLPAGISDEGIGRTLIAGARQGSANLTQRARDEQQQLMTGMPARPATFTVTPSGVTTTPSQPAQPGIGANAPVNARDVYYGPAGFSNARLHMAPGEYPAYQARLDQIRQAAIEAQHPFFQQFWGQLANGEVPYERFQAMRNSLGQDIEGYAGMSKGQQDQLYEAMTDAMRDAAFQRGGQALADRFDIANANYKRLIGAGGQREQLEAVGGKPQSGGWDQFMGPNGQTQPAVGVDFTGGKGEQQAADWFKNNVRSPSSLAPFADPTNVPNEFWRQVVGQWYATRGQTPEGTYRPDQMAREFGGEDVKSNTGVGGEAQTQLFTGPQGAPTANIQDMADQATLGRNSVVAINRSGLTDTAGSVFALKWLADQAKHALGTAGGLAAMMAGGRSLSDPDFVNAIRGRGTPLVNSLYAGVPAATQNILQYQNNPPSAYDPLGYSVTVNQNPPQ